MFNEHLVSKYLFSIVLDTICGSPCESSETLFASQFSYMVTYLQYNVYASGVPKIVFPRICHLCWRGGVGMKILGENNTQCMLP